MRNWIREYYDQIESGAAVVCEKTKRTYAYLVYKLDHDGEDGYIYNDKKANRIIKFAENFCRNSKGKYGGKLVKLELWEKAMLSAIFGFTDIEGFREYTEALLIVGKKNGKSLLASIVGNYMLTMDGEAGPEVYAVATKRDQAKIIWMEAKRMVQASPDLQKRVKCLVGELSTEELNNGVFKPLASDTNTLDGLNVSCGLMDEIHQWQNGKALYDIIADGVVAREQPLIFITSTAGTVREDLYDLKYDEAERVINGYGDESGYHDANFIAFIYELDARSEWTDPNCWKKANPGLGTIKNEKTLAAKVEKAKQNPALVKNLVCKEFNIRETGSESWLTFEQIDNRAIFDVEQLQPKYFIGGVDLSSTTDLTCATALFMTGESNAIYVLQQYFMPEDRMNDKVQQDKVPYDLWRDKGLITVCPGNKVDYHMVVSWFVEMQSRYNMYLVHCGYDSWSAQYFVDDMANTFGPNVMAPVIQGKKTLSSPMKSLGADLAAKRINYNNNPVLKWCMANTAVDVDRNNNIQPNKTHAQNKRIDGLASLLDAYVELERNQEEYLTMI